jgi:hypothetical protein
VLEKLQAYSHDHPSEYVDQSDVHHYLEENEIPSTVILDSLSLDKRHVYKIRETKGYGEGMAIHHAIEEVVTIHLFVVVLKLESHVVKIDLRSSRMDPSTEYRHSYEGEDKHRDCNHDEKREGHFHYVSHKLVKFF